MPASLTFALVLTGTSALTVLGILLLVGALRGPRGSAIQPLGPGGDAAFLIDSGALIDVNPRGASLLDSLRHSDKGAGEDWTRLSRFLMTEFPDFQDRLDGLPVSQQARVPGRDDNGLELTLEWVAGAVRVVVIDTRAEDASVVLDRLSYRALQDELTLLREVTEQAPLLLWREDSESRITWANAAYLKCLTDARPGEALRWPMPVLFNSVNEPGSPPARATHIGARKSWFDISRVEHPSGTLNFAVPADAAHRAERAKHEFVQTLTKTFATLPIGLAVFDRSRRLQMFNPALTDLTGLEPEFLLSKPGIEGFLNRMRDKHVLPEPRDYRSWAKRLLDIEMSAPTGGFEETWSLSSGQTFRVSANPHPDGALAFLIEDITSETHLTRNVRAEMETSQSVLNQLDDAIAVFAPNGELLLTNTAFSELWTLDGEETLTAVTLPEALENWREAGDDPELWNKVAALTRAPRSEATAIRGLMRLPDGETLQVDARRTSTGAVMITFAPRERPAPESSRAQVLRASA
ncbi:PAS-domain containing protein [Rhodobacter sp. NTK016B]|uniref:PAS-domain containing protein n=1 Tax=Rhodobacter sp. NTK016B TaxID=2759676 RepID=UPI001A8FFBC3|nr:PAS-domain containing protein [Rhodobacter sp. NTK016B]MBN8292200.1 PAS-domain containing protein [Rhodobacter sp. NTK016B]